ncbi:cation diffusion facilitator family transporter [Ligilactobacillus equi]|uniref:Cation efflux system protein n=1 Tax=Ligilactobacillus equi DPC 6820 TaxID=1392007 RepID=V7HWZ2_9LACO|nr:cation diffusion facilitator family transporter [Ligilactobacillus equi]ETA74387.1 cation efflux system protein [Ligilactobacillus equi DPC 6820]
MHNHQHDIKLSKQRFTLVTLLNLAITLAEIIGGLLSGSLALLSDAFHNFGDSFAIILSYSAQLIAGQKRSPSQTYGYKRAEILAALLNSLFLVVMSVFLSFAALKRLGHPETIDGPVMLTVAIIGLLANLISALLLASSSKHNLNIKATYLHILSDALSSLAVIGVGLVLTFIPADWLDPLLTILVSGYIIWEAWPIIKKTLIILMEAAPDLDYAAIKADILQIPNVTSIHHIHAWMIDEHDIIFSAHINLSNCQLSQAEVIYSQIERLLQTKYHISHTTIQAEYQRGLNEDLFDSKNPY